MFSFSLQCFETIECAYDWVVTEELENQIIFVHSGMYHREYLFIDTNVAIIGAGKFMLYTGLYIKACVTYPYVQGSTLSFVHHVSILPV